MIVNLSISPNRLVSFQVSNSFQPTHCFKSKQILMGKKSAILSKATKETKERLSNSLIFEHAVGHLSSPYGSLVQPKILKIHNVEPQQAVLQLPVVFVQFEEYMKSCSPVYVTGRVPLMVSSKAQMSTVHPLDVYTSPLVMPSAPVSGHCISRWFSFFKTKV